MPPRYWTPIGGLTDLPGGIGIVEGPGYPNFFNEVAAALGTLHARPQGRLLINGLINRRTQNRVYTSIKPPRENGDRNEAQSLGGDMARTALAVALGTGDTMTAVNELKVAMNATGHHNDYAWLAQELNATPRYAILGMPAGAAPGNYGVLAADAERWLKGERDLFKPFQDPERAFLQNAVQLLLHRLGRQRAGPGSNSVVYWNSHKTSCTMNTGVVSNRPAFIGLGHELIHAYHNVHGTQLSWSEEADHSSGFLYEFLCVGLGPFAGVATPTENGLRAEHQIPLRPAY